jgi:acetyl-CoA acetyltransferase
VAGASGKLSAVFLQKKMSLKGSPMRAAYIPYGGYWSTPFSKWQMSLAHLHSLKLAARVARDALDSRKIPLDAIDMGVLGVTNPQASVFYGLPWLTGMIGLEGVTGPTVQQACATSARALQMGAQEILGETATCALVVCADRCSNGAILNYPDATSPGGRVVTEAWVLDNFGNDPHARNAMLDTAENAARIAGVGTAEQHEVVLLRHAQYQDALADDRKFQRRYMVDVPITDSNFRRQTGVLTADEGVFPTTAEALAKLRPVKPDGTVTPGGQTHPADGNAGAIVTTRARARELSADAGIEIELAGFGMARAGKGMMSFAVPMAAKAALKSAGLEMGQIDVVKTHNPFVVNDILFSRDTGFPLKRMNNFGSSLIFGHPQGPTGMRLVIELIEELAMRGGGTGLFSGCAAGDSAMAVIVRVGGRG